MKLGDLCRFTVGDKDADFWLVKFGADFQVGKPSKTFDPENIAVKVTRTDLLLPQFLYYMMEHFYNQGFFAATARGTAAMAVINLDDLRNIPVEPTK